MFIYNEVNNDNVILLYTAMIIDSKSDSPPRPVYLLICFTYFWYFLWTE